MKSLNKSKKVFTGDRLLQYSKRWAKIILRFKLFASFVDDKRR